MVLFKKSPVLKTSHSASLQMKNFQVFSNDCEKNRTTFEKNPFFNNFSVCCSFFDDNCCHLCLNC